MKRIHGHLIAIAHLKQHSLHEASVIGAYHMRRVAPLMACAPPLFKMVLGAPLEGTMLSYDPLRDTEIT
jgi:hypothetical protein